MKEIRVLIISNNALLRKHLESLLRKVIPDCCYHSIVGSQALNFISLGPWDSIISDSRVSEITELQIIDVMADVRSEAQLLVIQPSPSRFLEAIQAHGKFKNIPATLVYSNSSAVDEIEKYRIFNNIFGRADSLVPKEVELDQVSPHNCLEQIVAYYQPQIRLDSGMLYGAEALARWDRDMLGVFGPQDIFPLLNNITLREELWGRMLIQTTGTLKSLQNTGLNIALNICADIPRSVSWAEHLATFFKSHNISTHNFTVEITETSSQDSEPSLAGTVAQLRLRGFNCAIDDFGTGFSSLHRLATVPFNKLKIDKGFIQRARSSATGHKLLHNTVALAHDLGLVVIAEGIETEEDYQRISEAGADIGQGYYFAKPMPLKDFIQFTCDHTDKGSQRINAVHHSMV